tara:strand:- start:2742 stop:6065 length:3324 start_codon:yes stop_codon:yes gene_type:complete
MSTLKVNTIEPATGTTVTLTGLVLAGSGIVSGSSIATGAQGAIALTTNNVAATALDLGVKTDDSPQFAGVNIGHASDTTLTRASSGDVNIEGNIIYRAGGTDVPVADGGTGASTLTDGGILLGSGTGAITAMAVLTDGQMIVGDGTTDPVAESGATLRTSIGVGTGDSPQLTGIELGHASDSTITRVSAGVIAVEGATVRTGTVGVDVGGTGATSLTDGGILLGSGTGAITAMPVLTDGQMIVGDGTTDPVAESGATLRTSIGVGTGDSPQLTGIELGHASDTTLTRASAGVLAVEGVAVQLHPTEGGFVNGDKSKLDAIEASATADQTKADINGLAITTVGTLDTGNATAIVSAASATAAGKVELATTAETATGTDASRAVTPDGLKDGYPGSANVTTLGTIATGVWNGTAIAHAYIGADAIDGDNLADNAVDSEHYTDGSIDTAHIADDQVTYAKVQNVSATNRILGRDSDGAGVIEEITPANIRTMINVENAADVTDAANVKTALGGAIGSNALQIGNGDTTTTFPGDVVITGTQTVNNVVTVSTSNGISFEGAAADGHDAILKSSVASSDKTYTLPNLTGHVPLLAVAATATITSTPAELNLLDTSAAGTIVNSKALIYGSSGEVNATKLQVGGTDITSTPAELNLLDTAAAGTITNSKALIYGSSGEVNATKLQVGGADITSTPAELNLLDTSAAGTITNSKALIYGSGGEVNATKLQVGGADITSTPAELNLLDGVSGLEQADFTKLAAVTSTAAELNLLDGVSGLVQGDFTKLAALDATAAELNLMDGGTSATSTTVASGDRLVLNNDGTMVQINVDDLDTYFSATSKTLSNKTVAASQVTEISGLTADEGAQLENIGSTTISANQWGYLGAASAFGATLLDDADAATSRATLGLNNVTNTSDSTKNAATVTLTNKTIAISQVTELSNLTAVEGAQLENIGSTTISATQWGYLGAFNQALVTTSDVQFNDVQVDSLGIGTAASGTTGEIRATNDVTAFYSSDERLKENIVQLDRALDKVNSLRGVTFDWKDLTDEERKTIHSHEGSDIGVIAQEVQEQYPELVQQREHGYLSVDYQKLTAVLIEAVKELSQKVTDLEHRI